MRGVVRALSRAGAVTGAVLLALVVILAAVKSCAHTPAITDERGREVPGSIATLEYVPLGGVPQAILVRGWSAASPVLLFLHSGPGMPEMSLAHAFQREIERDFVVVHWDQRGAGKSYEAGRAAPEAMRVSRLLDDASELVGILDARLGRRPLVVLGHSFGSYLGLLFAQRHPDRVAAYVGVGQVVDTRRERAIGDDFVRRCIRSRGDDRAAAAFEADRDGLREEWLFRCGGELRGATSFFPLAWMGLLAPEYTLGDVRNLVRGVRFTHARLVYDAIEGEVGDAVKELGMPAWFFVGRHDYNTPGELVVELAGRLVAPRKSVVWFEESAHFPFLEEPEKFARELRKVKLAVDGSRSQGP